MPQLRYGNIHFQRRGVAQDIYHPYPRQLYTRRNGYKADGGGDFSEDDDIKRAEGTYDEGVKESSQEGIYGHTLEDYNIHGQVGVTQVVTMYPK